MAEKNGQPLFRSTQIAQMLALKDENRRLKQLVDTPLAECCRLSSQPLVTVERMIDKVARTDSTVLISGASGTCKGLVARAIHQAGRRAGGSFIPIRCGAIPESLIESEPFGHSRAF